MRKTLTLAAVLASVGVLAYGCGGDSDESEADLPEAPTAAAGDESGVTPATDGTSGRDADDKASRRLTRKVEDGGTEAVKSSKGDPNGKSPAGGTGDVEPGQGDPGKVPSGGTYDPDASSGPKNGSKEPRYPGHDDNKPQPPSPNVGHDDNKPQPPSPDIPHD